jgi:hypothetical protein
VKIPGQIRLLQQNDHGARSIESLSLFRILTQRGAYALKNWRDARREFNEVCATNAAVRRIGLGKGPYSQFAKDWYDEALGMLYFCDCQGARDEEQLEIAPSYHPAFDFRFRELSVQLTVAIPDWRGTLERTPDLRAEQLHPGLQRARRNQKLGAIGWAFSHESLTDSLDYVEPPGMRSREQGIAACHVGVLNALSEKAKKVEKAAAVADVLVVYGPGLNDFGSNPPLEIFAKMLDCATPCKCLSAYKDIYVVSSAPGWLAQWQAGESAWKVGR